MRYIWQHIQTIIDTYNGSMPLAHFLKNYCKQYPQLGSRDRKLLAEMAYCWYRCNKAIDMPDGTFEQQMQACLRLCGNEAIVNKLLDKENITVPTVDMTRLFTHDIPLSDGITKKEWIDSVLVQPALFIRVRKQKTQLTKLLDENKIPYQFLNDTCMSLPNGAKIDALLPAMAYVVQDASSQQTGAYFHPQKHEKWYDCCSGAGGKSLLLKDMEPTVQLTVTDVRETILHNLQERVRNYGHAAPSAYVTDVADAAKLAKTMGDKLFDNIICDAPCSGSGTWARTPEQMYFFDPLSLERFSQLQASIATNVARYLKPGGKLIYITCSVFTVENEDVVNEVAKNTGLKVVELQLINGINIKADNMFIAVLQAS